jgi:hypothetical protein
MWLLGDMPGSDSITLFQINLQVRIDIVLNQQGGSVTMDEGRGNLALERRFGFFTCSRGGRRRWKSSPVEGHLNGIRRLGRRPHYDSRPGLDILGGRRLLLRGAQRRLQELLG